MLLRAGALENRAFRYSAMVGAGAVACLVAVWSAEDGSSTASAADALASRFPSEAPAAAVPAQARLDEQRAAADRALLIPSLTYPPTLAMSRSAPLPASPPPAAAPVQAALPAPAPARHAGPQLASVNSRPAPMPAARTQPQPHSPNVLNDAQIASMKQRLNLTPEQERMWPSVEAALRKLAYAKNHDKKALASIDPSSVDVQDLKWAAFPLVLSFSDDQRRELIDLAHVAGLEKLVPQF
jgi:hypothetical protein